MTEIILASGSEIRQILLRNAGVDFRAVVARVDEDAMRDGMLAEGASARDIADALAEMKAQKVSARHPEALVIGCDQVLNLQGAMLTKPESREHAREQLMQLRGKRHELLSAAVICEAGKPLWRHVGQVRLTMRMFSESYLDAYIARNWDSIRHSVGAYKLEEEGVRLFSQVQGDYFTVLGLPLLELLSYLTLRGDLDG
ncbi:septum formation protein [Roseovarius halotolerans]|uniref:Nucleoside triphosphate pyrophosphatase n=1 Tax=Roseovarius halotolerans TaxID=505353 RepID=A0A1X6Z3K3_9RHOB|nr:nucleoside triphosphate pyrophosphatase [Roseovarius halotolerans]RKT32300.1 septum formation protein [Roseovarius halotolerans]SLN39067.1 Maf-like protein YceF [Roseovarius halotolerans]